jgi:hypothetical protein
MLSTRMATESKGGSVRQLGTAVDRRNKYTHLYKTYLQFRLRFRTEIFQRA